MPRGLVAVLLAVGVFPAGAWAATITVPDQAATIQAALDAGPDTVLIRPGAYPEPLIARGQTTLLGLAADPADRPVIAGLTIPAELWGRYEFRRLRLDRFEITAIDGENVALSFVECDLPAGIIDVTPRGAIDALSLTRCDITGALGCEAAQHVLLDSCRLVGTLWAPAEDHVLEVRDCTILGGIRSSSGRSFVVAGNTVRGGSYGVRVDGQDITITDNVIEDIGSDGIYAYGDLVRLENNVIRRCGPGINAGAREQLTVNGNIIEQSRSNGLSVGAAPDVDVIGNVFWMCVADGMKIFDGGARTHVRVRQNTSCYNGLSGFVSESHQDVLEWVGNIGYGNGQYGVRWLNAEPATIGCNDWFANRIGAVQGRPFAAGDMAVDPLFCDGLAGDVRLDAASPLLDGPGCGLVGALGAGCGATATLVQRFTAGRAAEGIRVLWEVAEGATASEIWVERADGTTGEAWSRAVMERSSEGRAVAELDRGAALDRVYRYRLVAREGGNVVVLAPGVVVEAQERLEFRLVDVGPNPGGGPVRIAFGLARAAAIEIAVFDLLGRRVASPARGSWPAGTHEVVWSGRTNGEQPAPSGVYLVRYAFPGGQDRRPIVRLH